MEYFGELDHTKRKVQSQPHHDHDHHLFVKAAAQVLFSVTIFWAVILLYSPVFYPRLKLYFTAYSVQSLTYNSNKNYMFLLCNGILVVLVKNSGLIKKSSTSSLPPQSHPPPSVKPETTAVSLPEMETGEFASAEVVRIEEQGNAGDSVEIEIQEDNEMEGDGCFHEAEAEIFVTNDGDEDEIEEEEMSIEELNRKCEDFIKRVRGEINFELH